MDEYTAGALIAKGETIRQIQTPYATAVAVQKPRDMKEIARRCLEEAELAGDLFFYRWEVKSTDQKTKEEKTSFIEGPSINLTLCAARNFGNTAIAQRPLQETDASWIFTAAVIDLETGFTLERQYRMDKKFTIYGRMDQFRKDDIRFQIGQSKAIRNVINNYVPAGLVEKMIEAAKGSVRSKIEKMITAAGGEIAKVISRMLTEFKRLGIDQEKIEAKIGLTADAWDIEILTLLSGDLRALKNGNETAESLYGGDEHQGPATGTLSPDDMKAGDPATRQGYEAPSPPPEEEKPQPKTGNGAEKPKPVAAATSEKPKDSPPPLAAIAADTARSQQGKPTGQFGASKEELELELLDLLNNNEQHLWPEIMAEYSPRDIHGWPADKIRQSIKMINTIIGNRARQAGKGAPKEPEQAEMELPNGKGLPKNGDKPLPDRANF